MTKVLDATHRSVANPYCARVLLPVDAVPARMSVTLPAEIF